MPRMPSLARAALSAAVLASAAAAARAQDYTDTVDLQLAGNAAVKGTIRSAYERERFLLKLPQGAVVTGAAKRKGKGSLVPQLDLVNGAEEPVTGGTPKGKGSSLKAPALSDSGDYRLRVFGDGSTDGDYQLKIGVKYLAKWRSTGTAAPVDPVVYQVTFGAPTGAKAQIKLKPGRGSEFVPSLDLLTGPGGYSNPLSGTGAASAVLGAAGTYTIEFTDAGEAGGEWSCDVKLKLPRVKKSTIDISAAALTGSFSSDEPVFGREVGPEGGLVDPPDDGGVLDGASVDIPAGSLGFPVVITIHEADPFDLLNGDYPAGPAIDLGPSGTEFEPLAATVTIPFDPTLFTDPASEMHVYVLHDGEVVEVTPLSFPGPGLVSFPTSGFSTFVAARGGPRPLVGEWAYVRMRLGTSGDFGGSSDLSLARLEFDAQDVITYSDFENPVTWVPPPFTGQDPPRVSVNFPEVSSFERGTYNAFEDRRIEMSSPSDYFVFRRGDDGGVLLAPPSSEDSDARFRLALRRVVGTPTPLNLAGRYHVLTFGVGAEPVDTSGTLYRSQGFGTAVLTTDGRWTMEIDHREAEASYPSGPWSETRATRRVSGELGFDGDVYFFPDGEESSQQFVLCLDGDVLVALTRPYSERAELTFLIREASSLSPSVLAGPTTSFGVTAAQFDPIPNLNAPALAFGSFTISSLHNAGRLSVPFLNGTSLTHDAAGQPIGSRETSSTESGTFSLARDGAYRSSSDRFGFVTRGRGLFLFGTRAPGRSQLFAGIPGDTLGFLSGGSLVDGSGQ